MVWNVVGENCKLIRDRFFFSSFLLKVCKCCLELGEEIKVDVIFVNYDFILRKKKERKKINVWYIGLFVMYIG